MVTYCEKYYPTCINDLLGNRQEINSIVSFLKNFDKMKKKSMIISGCNGSGKKCCVNTILTELKYEKIFIDISKIKIDSKRTETGSKKEK